ncbi:hypothetical protein GSI_05821 [Ganoderma sinense ZZ0214-1]|uniref:Uncharacterized protein n=1 Tax=Ganoderma sinense ZZ0214-1 TaxID=1077348 RepID=A0A2G8SBH8_9APHY|nr:hypothetical protein GSI_05821 [Ganoderma sinense ZZ0214-1]
MSSSSRTRDGATDAEPATKPTTCSGTDLRLIESIKPLRLTHLCIVFHSAVDQYARRPPQDEDLMKTACGVDLRPAATSYTNVVPQCSNRGPLFLQRTFDGWLSSKAWRVVHGVDSELRSLGLDAGLGSCVELSRGAAERIIDEEELELSLHDEWRVPKLSCPAGTGANQRVLEKVLQNTDGARPSYVCRYEDARRWGEMDLRPAATQLAGAIPTLQYIFLTTGSCGCTHRLVPHDPWGLSTERQTPDKWFSSKEWQVVHCHAHDSGDRPSNVRAGAACQCTVTELSGSAAAKIVNEEELELSPGEVVGGDPVPVPPDRLCIPKLTSTRTTPQNELQKFGTSRS